MLFILRGYTIYRHRLVGYVRAVSVCFSLYRIVGDDDNGQLFSPDEYDAYKKKVLPMVSSVHPLRRYSVYLGPPPSVITVRDPRDDVAAGSQMFSGSCKQTKHPPCTSGAGFMNRRSSGKLT